MSGSNGVAIVNNYLGETAKLGYYGGYELRDGTSMAVPHVTGAIASIWRACPKCKNTIVLNCLKQTAWDRGKPGRDEEFGYGVPQTKAAYDCLKKRKCCK